MTVHSSEQVALNGGESFDPDGDPLRYSWTQILGKSVGLLDSETIRATCIAPNVSNKRLLRFRLQVRDMEGPDDVKGANSLLAYVNEWVPLSGPRREQTGFIFYR